MNTNTSTRDYNGPSYYEIARARILTTPCLQWYAAYTAKPGYEHWTPDGVWLFIAQSPVIVTLGYMLQNTNIDGRGRATYAGRTGRVTGDQDTSVSGYHAGASAPDVVCMWCGGVVSAADTLGKVCRACCVARGGDTTTPETDADTALEEMFARYGVRPAWCPAPRVWRVEHTHAPARPWNRYHSGDGYVMSGQYDTFADAVRDMRTRFTVSGAPAPDMWRVTTKRHTTRHTYTTEHETYQDANTYAERCARAGWMYETVILKTPDGVELWRAQFTLDKHGTPDAVYTVTTPHDHNTGRTQTPAPEEHGPVSAYDPSRLETPLQYHERTARADAAAVIRRAIALDSSPGHRATLDTDAISGHWTGDGAFILLEHGHHTPDGATFRAALVDTDTGLVSPVLVTVTTDTTTPDEHRALCDAAARHMHQNTEHR